MTDTRPAHSVEQIDRELSRRQDDITKLGRTQETLENERESVRDRLEIIEQSLNRDQVDGVQLRREKGELQQQARQLTEHIGNAMTAISKHRTAISKLQGYKLALETIKQGLPAGIIRK